MTGAMFPPPLALPRLTGAAFIFPEKARRRSHSRKRDAIAAGTEQ